MISFDCETFYDDDLSVKKLGNVAYARATDIFMVSLYDHATQRSWVGEPHLAPWHWLEGEHVCSHNVSFDSEMFAELQRRGGKMPAPLSWNCTADLSAFLQAPRALADAARELLGVQVTKDVRDSMKGRRWSTVPAEEQAKWASYAIKDAQLSWHIWNQYSGQWPEHERQMSRHTARMANRGIAIDLDRVKADVECLKQVLFECERRIPWAGTLDAKGKEIKLTSPKELVAECRRNGVEPPANTNSKSDEFEAWFEENEDKADFILAIQEWRRANRILKIMEQMADRTVDGRLRYGIMYCGAPHTGHWSGGGGDEADERKQSGLNTLNLPRDPLFITPDYRIVNLRRLDPAKCKVLLEGYSKRRVATLDGVALRAVDARAVLTPGDGKRLIVADWSQIQARLVRWFAGDTAMLEMIRGGTDIYEAHARASMGYADPRPLAEVDKAKRQLAKMRELQLGFQCGGDKFQVSAWTQYGVRISLDDAKRNVASYRRSNPKVVACWKKLDDAFKRSRGGDFQCELPSGRTINYWGVVSAKGSRGWPEYSARVKRGGDRKAFYGGKLFQNLVAGTARDLLGEAVLRIEDAGLPVNLHVHDETVMEVDAGNADDAAREIHDLMCVLPEWAEGLPVESEVQVRTEYGK